MLDVDWYPWYPLAFRRKTYRLSLAADGAYRRLIDEYMLNRKALPDDDRALARILGVSPDEWLEVAADVRPFFEVSGANLFHRRCDQELRVQDNRTVRFSERGKKAAYARYSVATGAKPWEAEGISRRTWYRRRGTPVGTPVVPNGTLGIKAAYAKYSKINGLHTRRMLVPATLQDNKIESSTNSDSEIAKPPQELGEKETKSKASSHLTAAMHRKGWA
jgi:uncharacterized protein YdaU (DUF1376 family)